MGLFAERNEELPTWAVLPAEPLTADDAADRLDGAVPASPADVGGGMLSISVTVVPVPANETAGDGDV